MAEYGSMFTVSGLASILFFGGWNGPIPIFGPDFLNWGYTPEEVAGGAFRITGYLANLAGCMNFIGKTVTFVTVMIWVRWTLPRLRIDQVMTTCLKYCVPLAAGCFLGVVCWQYGFFIAEQPLPSLNDLRPEPPRAEVREGWLVGAPPSPAKTASDPVRPTEAVPRVAARLERDNGGAP